MNFRELFELRKDFKDAFNDGRYNDAIYSGNKIIDLYEQDKACSSEGYADDLNNLAIVYDYIHLNDKAKELYRKSAKLKKKLSGENSHGYMDTLTNLGILLSITDEFAEAEEILKTVAEGARQIDGINSERYVKSMYNLGNMYADSERYEKSIEILDEALDCAKRVRNFELSEFEDIHISIAYACGRYGNLRRARDEYEKSIKIYERCGGEDSYFRMSYLLDYANACKKCEQYKKAAEIYEMAVEMRERLMDTKHLDFISVLNNLAIIYIKGEDFQKAVETHTKVRELVEKMLGKDHVFYGDVLANLGSDYGAMEEWEQALKYYNEALEIKKSIAGETHIHYIVTLASLADIYEKKGDLDKAIELQNDALQLKSNLIGQIHSQVSDSSLSLGRLYMKKGDNLKAQSFLMQALLMNKELIINGGQKSGAYAENIRLMAETCCNMNDKDKAIHFCESLAEYRKNESGEKNPKYARALYDSAEILMRLGEYRTASDYLKTACDIAETMLGTDTPFFLNSIIRLCTALYEGKSFYEAEDRLKKATSVCRKYGSSEQLIQIMFTHAKNQYMLGFPKKASEIVFRTQGIVSRKEGLEKLTAEEMIEYAAVMESCGDSKDTVSMLEKLYENDMEISNKAKYRLLMTDSRAMISCGEYEKAAERAKLASECTDSFQEKYEAGIMASKAFIRDGKFASASEMLEGALAEIEEKNEYFIKYSAEIYCMLGEACAMGSDGERALEYFEKGFSEEKARHVLPAEEYKSYLGTASAAAKRQKNYQKALEYLSENALLVRRDLGETIDFADILLQAGELYTQQKRYKDAVTMYDKSSEIYAEFYGKSSDKYLNAVMEACRSLIKDKKYKEAAERLEAVEEYGTKEEELKKLLSEAYKGRKDVGRFIRLKFRGKNS
ncbi:lipopolysaccharide assembly protein B [Clostridiales bacterium]|nr:lipopolysaccharide assembly protein B [Clostridiales bacterium]